MQFLKKIISLLKLSFPKLFGKEMLTLLSLSTLMVIRSILSIKVSDVNGSIVRAIVNRNINKFLKHIMALGLYSLPSAAVNSGLDYFSKKLGLYFRENVTNHFQKFYLNGMCFYQITNLDSRIKNPDQIFTADIEKWGYSLASLYSNFSKPILDVVLFIRKLSETLGYTGPMLILVTYFFFALILRYVAPPFGKMIAVEQSKYFI